MNPQYLPRVPRLFILQILLALALIALHSPHATSQDKRIKARISNAGFTITTLPLLAAKEWGIFSTNGLDIRCEEYLHRNSLLLTPHA